MAGTPTPSLPHRGHFAASALPTHRQRATELQEEKAAALSLPPPPKATAKLLPTAPTIPSTSDLAGGQYARQSGGLSRGHESPRERQYGVRHNSPKRRGVSTRVEAVPQSSGEGRETPVRRAQNRSSGSRAVRRRSGANSSAATAGSAASSLKSGSGASGSDLGRGRQLSGSMGPLGIGTGKHATVPSTLTPGSAAVRAGGLASAGGVQQRRGLVKGEHQVPKPPTGARRPGARVDHPRRAGAVQTPSGRTVERGSTSLSSYSWRPGTQSLGNTRGSFNPQSSQLTNASVGELGVDSMTSVTLLQDVRGPQTEERAVSAGGVKYIPWETPRAVSPRLNTRSSRRTAAHSPRPQKRQAPALGAEIVAVVPVTHLVTVAGEHELIAHEDEEVAEVEIVLDDWLRGFEAEQHDFASLALYGEIKLAEATQMTRAMGMPNDFVTALSCNLLDKMRPALHPYSDLVKLLSRELHKAVFVNHDEVAEAVEVLEEADAHMDEEDMADVAAKFLLKRRGVSPLQKLLHKSKDRAKHRKESRTAQKRRIQTAEVRDRATKYRRAITRREDTPLRAGYFVGKTYSTGVKQLKGELAALHRKEEVYAVERAWMQAELQRRQFVFNSTVSHWQFGLLNTMFNAWKTYWRHVKVQEERVDKATSGWWLNPKDTLWVMFRQWQEWLERHKRTKLVKEIAEHDSVIDRERALLGDLTDQLNDAEARTNRIKEQVHDTLDRWNACKSEYQSLKFKLARNREVEARAQAVSWSFLGRRIVRWYLQSLNRATVLCGPGGVDGSLLAFDVVAEAVPTERQLLHAFNDEDDFQHDSQDSHRDVGRPRSSASTASTTTASAAPPPQARSLGMSLVAGRRNSQIAEKKSDKKIAKAIAEAEAKLDDKFGLEHGADIPVDAILAQAMRGQPFCTSIGWRGKQPHRLTGWPIPQGMEGRRTVASLSATDVVERWFNLMLRRAAPALFFAHKQQRDRLAMEAGQAPVEPPTPSSVASSSGDLLAAEVLVYAEALSVDLAGGQLLGWLCHALLPSRYDLDIGGLLDDGVPDKTRAAQVYPALYDVLCAGIGGVRGPKASRAARRASNSSLASRRGSSSSSVAAASGAVAEFGRVGVRHADSGRGADAVLASKPSADLPPAHPVSGPSSSVKEFDGDTTGSGPGLEGSKSASASSMTDVVALEIENSLKTVGVDDAPARAVIRSQDPLPPEEVERAKDPSVVSAEQTQGANAPAGAASGSLGPSRRSSSVATGQTGSGSMLLSKYDVLHGHTSSLETYLAQLMRRFSSLPRPPDSGEAERLKLASAVRSWLLLETTSEQERKWAKAEGPDLKRRQIEATEREKLATKKRAQQRERRKKRRNQREKLAEQRAAQGINTSDALSLEVALEDDSDISSDESDRGENDEGASHIRQLQRLDTKRRLDADALIVPAVKPLIYPSGLSAQPLRFMLDEQLPTQLASAATAIVLACDNAHAGEAAWDAALKVCGEPTWVAAAHSAHEKDRESATDPEKERERIAAEQAVEFQSIPIHRIDDLLKHHSEADSEFASVNELLRHNAGALRAVYRSYGAASTKGGATLNLSEFWRFIKDARLPSKELTFQEIDMIFLQVNRQEKEDDDDDGNPSDELTPREYLEALIRIAEERYPKLDRLDLQLREVMEEHVNKYCRQSNPDEFRQQLDSEEMKAVFKEQKKPLRDIYSTYSRHDRAGKGGHKPSMTTMSREEWLAFVKAYNFIDVSFAVRDADRIFANVQNEEFDESSTVETELVFLEFCEAVATLAAYKLPDPFLPLEKRVEAFIEHVLAPGPPEGDMPPELPSL